MSDVVKRNWWVPAPILLIGCGILVGLMSHGRRIDNGWDPSPLDIAAGVALAGVVFVVLPIVALMVRRSHPGMDVLAAGTGGRRRHLPPAVAG